jgi:hypothetical protein
MQALKALVIFMGILIFVAMGFLVYGLLNLDDDKDPPKLIAGGSFGVVESRLPAGATVRETLIEDGRAVVTVGLADGGVEIRIFDLANGTALGVIRLGGAQ